MKKIILCTTLAAAAAMTACTDYREQIAEAHDEYVSSKMSNYTDETESSGCLCALNSSGLTMNGGAYFYNYQSGGILNWNIYGCKSEYFPIVDLADWTWSNNSAGAWITEFGYDVKVELTVDPLAAVGVGLSVRVIDNNGNDIGEELSCPVVNVVGSQSIVSGTTTPQIDGFLSSSSFNSVSSPSSNPAICGDLWCGRDGDDVIKTGYENGNSAGVWYDYTDDDNHGDSKFTYPADVKPNKYGYIFGDLINTYRGIKGTVYVGGGYDYPYAGLAFNLFGDNNATDGIDITDWGGICLVYQSSIGLSIELGTEDEIHTTKYNNYKASVPKSVAVVAKDFAWDKFKQEEGWGVAMEQGAVLSRIATVRLRFSENPGTTGDFFIQSIGRLGTCGLY